MLLTLQQGADMNIASGKLNGGGPLHTHGADHLCNISPQILASVMYIQSMG